MHISKELSIGIIFQLRMNRLRKRHHPNVDMGKRGLIFAKCIVCESLKDLKSKLEKNNSDAKEYELKLKKRILQQESYRSLYHIWRSKFMQSKDEFLCVIRDKTDHAKLAFTRFQVMNKMIYELGQLPITFISMIVHGHGDERYAQYSNELWLMILISQLGHYCGYFKLWKKL